ncbi:mediator of RNA polymerase II transcription subunit 26-like [Zerene cesonia]|uniref:mediator of RNA polymerase II transcription subunit 26-like n=1 Tax=Zerene cesonia TaxID=33412 RepID=UPI0018E59A39|nr:mediator of RNA polymerase II transcription subunit 26-like [Zerene cesonia]
MSNNAHELSNRLLNALDSNYNVVDMQAVNEIISILEKFNITKELLETTRLGKHVNELRRKTTDPTLARRAKVLVKRWRDLVIPNVASPAHTGSNRSSAERQTRRAGGTPLTSPALMRHGLSPAVPSPRPPSRPAWGGYESDSQDVILVDDDPPPPPLPPLPPPPAPLLAHKPATPPVKRPPSPEPLGDDKKAKRDKKPKKRRGHSRAGVGTETPAGPTPAPAPPPSLAPAAAPTATPTAAHAHGWPARNGTAPERRKNGWRRDAQDPYAALVNRLPPAGGKKVKTTKELLEQIQSRGKASPSRSASPASPASPDVMLIEPDDCSIKVDSPLRNGSSEPAAAPEPAPAPVWPLVPLEDEKEWAPCICDPELEPDESCPANSRTTVHPAHVVALHNAYVPGVNGTRAPLHPHKFAVRPAVSQDDPSLFANVVPLYKYSDYKEDTSDSKDAGGDVKEINDLIHTTELKEEPSDLKTEIDIKAISDCKVEPMDVDITFKSEDVNERLKPAPSPEESERRIEETKEAKEEPEQKFSVTSPEHRTVERTKDIDGRTLYEKCVSCINSVPYSYGQAANAPVLTFPTEDVLENVSQALDSVETERDELGRPVKPTHFAEWHECAMLGDLIALPYVVID